MYLRGQKLECVDDTNFRNPHLAHLTDGKHPVKGQIYTFRGYTGGEFIMVEEIVGKPHHWQYGYGEGGWFPHRFRPITDISDLQKLLKVREQKLLKTHKDRVDA